MAQSGEGGSSCLQDKYETAYIGPSERSYLRIITPFGIARLPGMKTHFTFGSVGLID